MHRLWRAFTHEALMTFAHWAQSIQSARFCISVDITMASAQILNTTSAASLAHAFFRNSSEHLIIDSTSHTVIQTFILNRQPRQWKRGSTWSAITYESHTTCIKRQHFELDPDSQFANNCHEWWSLLNSPHQLGSAN